MSAVVLALVCAAGLSSVASGAKDARVALGPVISPSATACGSTEAALSVLQPQADEGGVCWADAAEDAGMQAPGVRPMLGFCQCGCGTRCATSADCGGNPCRAFITCC